MYRSLIKAIVKLCMKSILLTAMIAALIGIIGYVNGWNSPVTYSNAFFVAGGLVIIAGGMSRLAAGGGWNTFQWLSSESLRDMSSVERANFIIDSSSSFSLVALGVLTGILLILLSEIAAYLT